MAGTGIHPYHQQWPPAAALPPASAAAPPPPPPIPVDNPAVRPPSDEVRTIFISGLPEDVKERELQNLLRWLPGYEASQDMVFDADSKSVLHTEMAKKNLFVKRGIVADSNAYDQSKRMRTGGDYTQCLFNISFSSSPSSCLGTTWVRWVLNFTLTKGLYMSPAPPPYDPYAGYAVPPVPMPAPAPVPAPSSYVPIQNTKDNPPCNTLFIGNLGENINEEELRGLFSAQPGFKQMKILRQERHCFMLHPQDVNSATNVHHSLQGAVIPSSSSVGMRIQYPSNPFGKRKDSIYPAAAPCVNGVPPSMTYQ
ncbi:hypothetical protein Pfo_012363 [Paulownia fortunei]|nr:hypothetical protein Pfo_012363 [Paulownia fortunei]